MSRRRNGQALARANAIETEDINAPLMRLMKGLSIKLDRIVVENDDEKNETYAEKKSSVAPEPAKRRGRQASKKTQDVTKSDESQPNATASTSEAAKRRGRKPTKKAAGSSMPQMDEMNSDESPPKATARTSVSAKRRGRQSAKPNVEAKKRSLRSNSSADEVSWVDPEQQTKRKKRNQPQKRLQAIDSQSTDDDQVMANMRNNENVTHRRKDLSSTDEDDSISQADNESIELTHSDASESNTSKIVYSTMVGGKTQSKDMIVSDNEMTPLLSEKLDSSKSKSQNSSPESEILLGQGPKTVAQNTMDMPMDETPRNAPNSKENRREKINKLKLLDKIAKPSTSIDNNNEDDPEQAGESSTTFNRRHSEDIVNETAEQTDNEQSENDEDAQKKSSDHSSKSIFDTPEKMESDDNAGEIPSDMNVDGTLAVSLEVNNNVKVPSKQTADVVQKTSAHHHVEQLSWATIISGSAAMTKSKSFTKTLNHSGVILGLYPGISVKAAAGYSDVINELEGVLEARNDRKNPNEAKSDAVRHGGPSHSSTMAVNSADDNNEMDNDISHGTEIISDSEGENNINEPEPIIRAFSNSSPKGGNKLIRDMNGYTSTRSDATTENMSDDDEPGASTFRKGDNRSTPYRKMNNDLTMENTFDDEEAGASASLLEAPLPEPKK